MKAVAVNDDDASPARVPQVAYTGRCPRVVMASVHFDFDVDFDFDFDCD